MGAVPVPAGLGRLAGVPSMGIHRLGHPATFCAIRHRPVGAVTARGGLHVLHGDQGQQHQREAAPSSSSASLNSATAAFASFTSASFAAGWSQSVGGLPGRE